jgi:CDP-diacylglycerol--glycerol-3-phosphate 3-phosphatidyltransferase
MNPLRSEQILNLPNLLTLVRLGSIPVLVVLFYLPVDGWSSLAAAVFLVAGLTDLLDGWLARRMKSVTILGQYLDPVADKLLVSSVLIMFTSQGRVPAWITILIICREIAVTGMRALAANHSFTVPSDLWGKAKTALQMLGLFLIMLQHPLSGFDPQIWGGWIMLLAVFITAWSGVGYAMRFQRLLVQNLRR